MFRQRLPFLALLVLVATITVRAQQPSQIPPGPDVRVSDGWYHLADCSIAIGRQAPSLPLQQALRQSMRACPICEPLEHQPEWAAFVKAHGESIKAEVKAKADAEAAEAKRKAEADEAERVRRLKELEDTRRSKETAPVPRLTEQQARAAAEAALKDTNGDVAQFSAKYRARVRETSPEFVGPVVVYGSPALKIYAAGPVARFEAAAQDRIQRRLPIAGALWSPDVAIVVVPESIDAPDIKQVVVQRSEAQGRAGAETQATALSNTLAPHRLPNTPPTSKAVISGEVTFPMSAFEPGEGVIVRVIAVPATGAPLNRTFTLLALRGIQ
ncbi:MAG TPA: hypothetical protein VN700_19060 [Vicinamibacterales bacterium]|nr:hypothetical protein [Vicinamibacterales bacterium]